MGCSLMCSRQFVNLYSSLYPPPSIKQPPFQWRLINPTTHPFSSNTHNKFRLYSSARDQSTMSLSTAYQLLDLMPDCTFSDLKAAFRAKVKQFHPDVKRSDDDNNSSDTMIRLVIQVYQVLSNLSKSEIIESECLDPFDAPECEAFDIFVNEILCVGKARLINVREMGNGPNGVMVSLFLCKDSTSCLYIQFFNRNCAHNLSRSWGGLSGTACSWAVSQKLHSLCYTFSKGYFGRAAWKSRDWSVIKMHVGPV
ncbi:hypothetical protein M8C21_019656 [Ambrosia artemisiifolia]|uniref:J domain-containing protein n=1 Tax=Ambrosia artemisiifolia TaxID=4212 RepID=A0AAD5GH51_AMBAR|nr:hypothetical protein M8C21_019656 [Ambrosia artemisiifolia]